MSSFADFADAMAHPVRAPVMAARTFQKVAVLGGGPDARMLAAIALSEGRDVTLFSAYGAELDALRAGGGIALRGAGPVGSYQIDAEAAPSVRTTAELDAALRGADLIFLTGPVHKQRTYAMVLADHLSDGQVLVLAPGRTFGALEIRNLLSIGGCTAEISLVEAQALPFWFSASGSTLHLSPVSHSNIAAIPGGRADVLSGLASLLPGATPVINSLVSSFGDGSGLTEVPTLLLGGPALPSGGPEIPMGGTPLAENQSFRNLIGPGHLAVIEDLAEERRETARRFGIRDLPSTGDWLDAHAGLVSGEGNRAIPDQAQTQQIIRDAVIGSLVPLTSAARVADVPTPATDAMIALASSVLGANLATAGRALVSMGVDCRDLATARRVLEATAGGN